MIPWPNLPYELIGKATVAILTVVLTLVTVGLLIVAFLFVWIRGWKRIANRMWRGYDPDEERPPLWKMRVSWIAYALSQLQFRKIPAAWREATELADDNVTARKALVKGTRSVFGDE